MSIEYTQCRRDLDYSRHQLNSLIALFSYNDLGMMKLNKTRALCSLDCIKTMVNEVEEYINSLE